MRFISVDIESNQPSGKIIQIGAVAFDTDAKQPIQGEFNCWLNPGEPINWDQPLKGRDLTLGKLLPYGQEKMDEAAENPQDVFKDFWAWVKKVQSGKKMVQWGGGDMHHITTQSRDAGVDFPKGLRTIDLKVYYQFMYQPIFKLPKGYGLGTALKSNGMKFLGDEHNAYWDAYNTGLLKMKIVKHLERLAKAESAIKS